MSKNYRFQDLLTYRISIDVGMAIFDMTAIFPKEEKYSLTDQIRRSSRSVSANIAEAYAKRSYPKHFVSKLTDSDEENLETQVWLEYSLKCKYLDKEKYIGYSVQSQEVGKLIYYMINNPGKFGSG